MSSASLRIGAMVVPSMLVAWLLSYLPCQSGLSREDRILRVLRELEREKRSWRYLDASFRLWSPDDRQQQLVPVYDLFCATMSRDIDDARFRQLGLEAMRVYGLAPAVEVALAEVSGRLDALDQDLKIGFELKGRGDPASRRRLPEDPSDFLDDAEIDRLRSSGYRLYVVDRDLYSDDEDGFTPALAFLAGLVRFLNDATDGEDVELDGLLFEREASWKWEIQPPEGMRLEEGLHGPELLVERAGTVSIPCRGLVDFGPPRPHALTFAPDFEKELSGSTRGAPSVVVVKYSVKPLDRHTRPELRVRYRQTFRREELVHECRSFVAFLPREFDLAQPFELELELTPGLYAFYGGPARIGAAVAQER